MEGVKTKYSDDFKYRGGATGHLTSWKGGDMVGELFP